VSRKCSRGRVHEPTKACEGSSIVKLIEMTMIICPFSSIEKIILARPSFKSSNLKVFRRYDVGCMHGGKLGKHPSCIADGIVY
jgi:hypothetical protein